LIYMNLEEQNIVIQYCTLFYEKERCIQIESMMHEKFIRSLTDAASCLKPTDMSDSVFHELILLAFKSTLPLTIFDTKIMMKKLEDYRYVQELLLNLCVFAVSLRKTKTNFEKTCVVGDIDEEICGYY